jgi:hypothetical protein
MNFIDSLDFLRDLLGNGDYHCQHGDDLYSPAWPTAPAVAELSCDVRGATRETTVDLSPEQWASHAQPSTLEIAPH